MNGISLVIPAHNGAKVIENSLREYHSVLSKNFKNFEIIVVCNDCWDNTANICKKLANKLPVRVIEIPQRGKGYALITGFNNAKFDFLGFLDADNPFDLKKIQEMISKLNECDVIIASKYKRGTIKIQDVLLRRFISLLGSIFSRTFLGLKFRDTQAGAKFFRKEVWSNVGKNFTCTGFDFDMEFLYRVNRKKFRILEVYVPIRRDKFSTFRLKYLPGMLKRLLVMRFLR